MIEENQQVDIDGEEHSVISNFEKNKENSA